MCSRPLLPTMTTSDYSNAIPKADYSHTLSLLVFMYSHNLKSSLRKWKCLRMHDMYLCPLFKVSVRKENISTKLQQLVLHYRNLRIYMRFCSFSLVVNQQNTFSTPWSFLLHLIVPCCSVSAAYSTCTVSSKLESGSYCSVFYLSFYSFFSFCHSESFFRRLAIHQNWFIIQTKPDNDSTLKDVPNLEE